MELVGVAEAGRVRMVISGAGLEAPALIAGFDDIAMMREPIEQRRRHLCIAEDAWPLTEGKFGGDDDQGSLVEAADEMEEQLPAGLGEGQIAKFVEDQKVETTE